MYKLPGTLELIRREEYDLPTCSPNSGREVFKQEVMDRLMRIVKKEILFKAQRLMSPHIFLVVCLCERNDYLFCYLLPI